jgi:hypothetical protein
VAAPDVWYGDHWVTSPRGKRLRATHGCKLYSNGQKRPVGFASDPCKFKYNRQLPASNPKPFVSRAPDPLGVDFPRREPVTLDAKPTIEGPIEVVQVRDTDGKIIVPDPSGLGGPEPVVVGPPKLAPRMPARVMLLAAALLTMLDVPPPPRGPR